MRKYFHLSSLSSIASAAMFFITALILSVYLIISTFLVSYWFMLLVFFILFCLIISFLILKRLFLIGIKIEDDNVILQGLCPYEFYSFNINDIEKVELQDYKRNTIEVTDKNKQAYFSFALRSGRTKRIQLSTIRKSKFNKINSFFEQQLNKAL